MLEGGGKQVTAEARLLFWQGESGCAVPTGLPALLQHVRTTSMFQGLDNCPLRAVLPPGCLLLLSSCAAPRFKDIIKLAHLGQIFQLLLGEAHMGHALQHCYRGRHRAVCPDLHQIFQNSCLGVLLEPTAYYWLTG